MPHFNTGSYIIPSRDIAPDKYLDFLKEIGTSMDYDFNQIEENIAGLRGILKNLNMLEVIGKKYN